ncbi:MAG TPA: hypothetical protein VE439_09735 [Anaerolineae bacterium]|jgi:hypothetical protein|nr:hypothetical protein [Anaerolineae bacterium]
MVDEELRQAMRNVSIKKVTVKIECDDERISRETIEKLERTQEDRVLDEALDYLDDLMKEAMTKAVENVRI